MRFVTTLKWFVDYVYYMCASVFLCLKCILLSKSHWDYPLCSVIYSHRAKCLQKFIPTPDKKKNSLLTLGYWTDALFECVSLWSCDCMREYSLWVLAYKAGCSAISLYIFFPIQVQYTSLFMEFCCTGSFIDVIHLLYYLYQAANGWWLQKITRHNWAPF